jgi:hypothetical protein
MASPLYMPYIFLIVVSRLWIGAGACSTTITMEISAVAYNLETIIFVYLKNAQSAMNLQLI